MKKNKNKRGFSGLEFLLVSSLCGIFACVLLFAAFSTAKTEKIKTMRQKAQNFKHDAEAYALLMHLENDTIFLWDLIDNNIINDIESPFSKNNKCDVRNSYVTKKNNQTFVTLKCDNYLIYNEDIEKEKITIYSVSPWENTSPSSRNKIDKQVLYNYEKKGKTMLESPVSEILFLRQFNEQEKTNYENIYQIKEENIRIYGQTYYRVRKAILEISK